MRAFSRAGRQPGQPPGSSACTSPPRGLSAREPVREARAALEQHATATLTAAERAHLRSALAKIIAQLQNEPS